MENSVFKRHLIRKLIIGGTFVLLTIGSIIAINQVNSKVIAPNEGFITNVYSTTEWNSMELAGAVFLPAAVFERPERFCGGKGADPLLCHFFLRSGGFAGTCRQAEQSEAQQPRPSIPLSGDAP